MLIECATLSNTPMNPITTPTMSVHTDIAGEYILSEVFLRRLVGVFSCPFSCKHSKFFSLSLISKVSLSLFFYWVRFSSLRNW